jgi:hypothetical protein
VSLAAVQAERLAERFGRATDRVVGGSIHGGTPVVADVVRLRPSPVELPAVPAICRLDGKGRFQFAGVAERLGWRPGVLAYAVGTGTLVRSAADGVVVSAGARCGYGTCVVVEVRVDAVPVDPFRLPVGPGGSNAGAAMPARRLRQGRPLTRNGNPSYWVPVVRLSQAQVCTLPAGKWSGASNAATARTTTSVLATSCAAAAELVGDTT